MRYATSYNVTIIISLLMSYIDFLVHLFICRSVDLVIHLHHERRQETELFLAINITPSVIIEGQGLLSGYNEPVIETTL